MSTLQHADATDAPPHSHADIAKHVKVYYVIFGTLAFLTVVTVAAASLHMASAGAAITLALVIATIKASLVAGYFMHLIGERKIIFWCLALCAVFFVVLMCLPAFTTFETQSGPDGTAIRPAGAAAPAGGGEHH